MNGIVRVREFFGGMALSFFSWEAWENIVVSLIVALIGGFMAAAGKQIHKALYEWRQRCINRKNKKDGEV